MTRRFLLGMISFGVLAGAAACSGGSRGGGGAASTVVPATTALPVPVSSTTPAAVTSAAPAITPRTKTARVVARSGEGFLEDQGGVLILHLKGSSYDRGLQYGELLGDRIGAVFQALDAYAKQQAAGLPSWAWGAKPLLTAAGGALYQQSFRPDVIEMLNGVVDGAARRTPSVKLTLLDLVFVNSIIDIGATVQVPFFKCSGLAVWGSRTEGGKTFQLRNVDLMTGTGLESHAVVVIEKPEGKKAFANATWAGMVGSASGMNENGVALSQVWAFSKKSNVGEPWILTARRVLETAENVDGIEAEFAATTRTYGSNLVFADRGDGRNGVRRAVAVEINHEQCAAFGANDPREDATFNGTPIAIGLPEAVFRGDVPLSSAILANCYHVKPGQDPRAHGGYRDRYEQTANLVKGFAAAGTKIGAGEMLEISKKIAMRSGSLQCVVYENDDLRLHVANSRLVPGAATANACDEPFHACDLDYYLPTATVATDRGDYVPGQVVKLTIGVANRGRARRLDLRARLDGASGSVPLGGPTLGTVTALTGQATTQVVTLLVPATGAPRGACEVVLELVETGTGDVVDYARARVVLK